MFKSENTLTGCKLPNLSNSEFHAGYVEGKRPINPNAVSMEQKLANYTNRQAPLNKVVSEAEQNFKTYVNRHIDDMTLVRPPINLSQNEYY